MAKPRRRALPSHVRLAILCGGAALVLNAGFLGLATHYAPAGVRAGMLAALLPWAVVAAAVAAGVGAVAAIWLTYPLRRLTASAERLARGLLTERTGIHRSDEIGQLAAAFDTMAEELRRRLEENAELYRRERRRVQTLQALEEVAQAVNSTLSLDQVLDAIIQCGTRLTGLPLWTITLTEPADQGRVRCASGLSDRFLAHLEAAAARSCEHLTAEPVRVATEHDPTDPETAQLWREEGITGVATAPMVVNGRTLGCLATYSRESAPFSDEQLHILTALAAQAAVAVQNARLYEESQQKTHEVRSSFRRIGAALASGLRLDDTLALIAELAAEMLHADACLIRMLDQSGELAIRATQGMSLEDVEHARLRKGEGLSGCVAATGTPIAVEDILRDPRALGLALRSEVRAYLGVPLHAQARVIGVLAVFKREPYRFSREEIDLLATFGAQASVALENRRLYEQESHMARALQRSLLPAIPRDLAQMELGELYAPSHHSIELGGDFYDLFPLDRGRVGVVMGDVCGKGLRAAVHIAMAKYAIRCYAFDHPLPSEVVRRTNRALCRQITEVNLFVSVVFVAIDPASMELTLASAGHPPPVHYRSATGEAVLLESEGTLAGLLPHTRYEDLRVSLRAGDVLLLYTDGVSEARQGRRVWGSDGLAQAVTKYARLPPHELVQAIRDEALAFATDGIRDDMALLAVRMKGN